MQNVGSPCTCCHLYIMLRNENSPFGIAKKPRSIILLQYAWCIVSPIKMYTGQYSVCPVVMETVVLLLLRMMGTKDAP